MEVPTVLQPVHLLIAINASTLVAFLAVSYKVLRFVNRIEFKTDLLWIDYESRMSDRGHVHRRASDDDE